MRLTLVDHYARAADLMAMGARYDAVDRHRGRTDFVVQPALPQEAVERLGSSLLLGRYERSFRMSIQDMIDAGAIAVTAPGGRSWYMMPKMHAVYLAARAELDEDRTLHPGVVAHLAGVSQGYASKVIHRLAQWGFWTILGTFRGRWGGIVAKLRTVVASIIPPYRDGPSSTGGMIDRRQGLIVPSGWNVLPVRRKLYDVGLR